MPSCLARRWENLPRVYSFSEADNASWRFISCEKWRTEFKVDEIVENFVYVEKPKVFEYYPQFYHKIDKVGWFSRSFHWCRQLMVAWQDGRPVYFEQLGKINLTEMWDDSWPFLQYHCSWTIYRYKITTSERMLQNLVLEYERLADPRLVKSSPSNQEFATFNMLTSQTAGLLAPIRTSRGNLLQYVDVKNSWVMTNFVM